MAQAHIFDAMNNIHSLQKVLDAHHSKVTVALSKAAPTSPTEIDSRRFAASKLLAAKSDLTVAKNRFDTALEQMGKGFTKIIPKLVHESAASLHSANEALNHPLVVTASGVSSPISVEESGAVLEQAKRNHDIANGNR